ncbi:LuxR C-terminal-related transcriptional regulator [Propionicimonas sp.]|uniref:helix-turn-helix transcriptional regulator n=1 Tax=Propionicimonas sp. TaxID=1955623 RepID=UPI0039E2164C
MADVRRERLLEALDSPLPLVVVEAVPGGGKRTLLNQWAREQAAERRIVLRLAAEANLGQVRGMIGATLRRIGATTVPAGPEDGVAALRRQVQELPMPVALGLDGADHLPSDALTELLGLVVGADRLRMVIALFDGSPVIEAATQWGLPYAVLDDQDLEFTADEVGTLMRASNLAPVNGAATSVHHVTRGHPGLVAAVLEAFPDEAMLGTITSGQALSAFLGRLGPDLLGSGVADFVTHLVRVPRFSAVEARVIAQDDRAASHLHRLQRLGLGEMTYVAATRERMFFWYEPVRLSIARFLDEIGDRPQELSDRVLAAAERVDDHELRVATLVATGDLGGAERLLRDWLWDLLPDGNQPIWRTLQELSPQQLAGYPGLLCIWLRVALQPGRPPAPGVTSAIATNVVANTPREPWDRLAALARGLELARQSGEPELIKNFAIRARDLAAELPAAAAPVLAPATVSDLLVVAQTSLQLGNTTFASEFAQYAIRTIEADRRRLDPTGARLAFASRLVLFSSRERGREDPVEAAVVLSGWRGYSREGDAVAAHLAIMWRELDAGNLALAEAHCRLASDRVARPVEWPGLLFTRAIILAIQGEAAELASVARQYDRASIWNRDPALEAAGQSHEWANVLMRRLIGRDLPSPEFLPPQEGAEPFSDAAFAPRINHGVWLMEALNALRAGRLAVARSALERAITVLPSSGLAPVILSLASPDEVQQLAEIIRDHPGAADLRLEQACDYARTERTPPGDLSARELEILRFLRDGASNRTMAEAMFLSVNTVKFHRAKLMRKLGANSRDEALEAAARLGL